MGEKTSAAIDVRGVAVTSPTSPVGLLVRTRPVSIDGDAPVSAAASLMDELDVSALLVDGGGAIVTERDVARGVAAGCPPESHVRALASPHPLSVGWSLPIVRAAALMLNEHIRHLVVQLDGVTIGVVSLREIVAVLLQTADPELWLTTLRISICSPSESWIG